MSPRPPAADAGPKRKKVDFMVYIRGKRLTALLLALVLALGLAACGSDGKEEDKEPLSGTVYVPEFIDLNIKMERVQGGCSDGKNVYLMGYLRDEPDSQENYNGHYAIYRMPLDGGEASELENYEPFKPQNTSDTDNVDSYINNLSPGADGTLWVEESLYIQHFDLPEDFDPEKDEKYDYVGDYEDLRLFRQLDSTGNEITCMDASELTEKLEVDYIQSTVFDKEGDCYVSGRGKIAVLDPSMNLKFAIEDAELWGDELITLSDGSVGMQRSFNDQATNTYGYKVQTIDKAAKGWGKEYPLPRSAYQVYSGGGDYLFYYKQGDVLCGYKDGQEGVELVNWLEANINADTIRFFSFLADGRVVVMTDDWRAMGGSGSAELAVLSAVDRSTLPEKTTLTYAAMGLGYDQRNAIIDFNKTSTTHRIEVTDYSKYSTDEDYLAGLTRLNTEIVAGNVPDILDTGNLPLAQYAAKGILEDLWPYIENDPDIGRDSLMERPFLADERDGKLYRVFDSFSIQTVAGATDVVGDRYSWTVADLQEALAKMPEGCAIFSQYDTKDNMLSRVMSLNLDQFVDWETGECSFDSDAFKSLLTFCNSFPAEYDQAASMDDQDSDYKRISEGRQMLSTSGVYDFESIQTDKALFGGSVSYVGFPREDGGVGSSFIVSNGLSMSSTCRDKEGAWSFLCQLLLPKFTDAESLDRMGGFWGFPTNKHDFDLARESAMTPDGYKLDENGNQILDENGKPIEESHHSVGWGDGFMVDIYSTSQEEYDQIMALYNEIDNVYSYDKEIFAIVTDVAGSYFAGDRSLDDTAGQIQSRVKLYVNENR